MKNMKYLTVIVIIGILLVAFAATTSPKTQAMDKENSEQTASNFVLNDLNGTTHSLTEYKGKKVYVKYWASWCSICLGSIDEFEQLVNSKEGAEDIVILSMVAPGAFGEKSSVNFIQWYNERGYSFPVLLDEGGSVGKQFGVRAFPTSIYLSSNGVLISTTPGYSSNESIESKLTTFK